MSEFEDRFPAAIEILENGLEDSFANITGHDPKNSNSDQNKMLFEEYKLAIETQMHFIDLLIKLRTFGLAAVVAIFGYAVQTANSDSWKIAVLSLILLLSISIEADLKG